LQRLFTPRHVDRSRAVIEPRATELVYAVATQRKVIAGVPVRAGCAPGPSIPGVMQCPR
jgi:hypothetical protein